MELMVNEIDKEQMVGQGKKFGEEGL